jgi:CBS-domain-containing membrane protein
MNINKFLMFLGIAVQKIDIKEGIISGLGGFCGIAGVYLVSRLLILDDITTLFVVASMGSSAVLLFAAPHSPLTQPWNVLAGHLLAAFVGVSCAKYIGTELVAAAASVGISITLMYLARCLHPPAGATTLFAVIGGPSVHVLGYGYVFAPIFIDTLVILVVAMLFNYIFSWRRYPKYLSKGG